MNPDLPAAERRRWTSQDEQALSRRLADVRGFLRRFPGDGDGLMPEPVPNLRETLDQLETAAEEMSVTEEELRAKNDELAEINERLDRERERFRQLFQMAPDAYIVTDRRAIITDANVAAARLLGLALDRLEGKALLVYVSGQDQVRFSAALHEIDTTGSTPEWLTRIESRKGRTLDVAIKAIKAGDDEVRWILRDVTDRRRAEQSERRLQREQAVRAASEAAERQARFIAETSRSLASLLNVREIANAAARLALPELGELCMVDLGENGRVIQRAAVHHVERRQESGSLLDHSPAADVGAVRRVISGGELEVLHPLTSQLCEELAPGGSEILVQLGVDTAIVLPLTARNRTLGCITFGAVGIERSAATRLLLAEAFADRVALALDNARLLEESRKASAAKSNFISVMSHEFRTPLTSILGYADLLLTGAAGALAPGQKRHVERLRQSAWHLSELVDDVLIFSRAARNTAPVRLVPVHIRPLLDEIAGALKPAADTNGLALRVNHPAEEIEIQTDPNRLRQILLNIAGNAIKFTDKGEVRLAAERAGKHVSITVTDTGIGIAADDIEHLFEPFWQADMSETRKRAGTGLGLAVAYDLVAALDGFIHVESQPGKGTMFTIRLPA